MLYQASGRIEPLPDPKPPSSIEPREQLEIIPCAHTSGFAEPLDDAIGGTMEILPFGRDSRSDRFRKVAKAPPQRRALYRVFAIVNHLLCIVPYWCCDRTYGPESSRFDGARGYARIILVFLGRCKPGCESCSAFVRIVYRMPSLGAPRSSRMPWRRRPQIDPIRATAPLLFRDATPFSDGAARFRRNA